MKTNVKILKSVVLYIPITFKNTNSTLCCIFLYITNLIFGMFLNESRFTFSDSANAIKTKVLKNHKHIFLSLYFFPAVLNYSTDKIFLL